MARTPTQSRGSLYTSSGDSSRSEVEFLAGDLLLCGRERSLKAHTAEIEGEEYVGPRSPWTVLGRHRRGQAAAAVAIAQSAADDEQVAAGEIDDGRRLDSKSAREGEPGRGLDSVSREETRPRLHCREQRQLVQAMGRHHVPAKPAPGEEETLGARFAEAEEGARRIELQRALVDREVERASCCSQLEGQARLETVIDGQTRQRWEVEHLSELELKRAADVVADRRASAKPEEVTR